MNKTFFFLYYCIKIKNAYRGISSDSSTLLDNIKNKPIYVKVLFTFSKIIRWYQLKLEWTHQYYENYNNFITMNNIVLLYPIGTYINSEIFNNELDKNDYRN